MDRIGRSLAIAGAVALLTAAPASAARLHGLVIGIDEYQSLRPLEAAVRDADDIAESLRRAGAASVTVLRNEQATRAAIAAAWQDLLATAEPGDTVVFSYAGHGGQEPERIAGSERDGKDEVLLLGGFATSGAGTAERILDDELGAWFDQAKHLNLLFVADSCHSGTLTRSVDPRVRILGTRFAEYGPIEDDALLLPPSTSAMDERDQTHVTFLSAVADGELAPELMIEGTPRGALSWAFARALDGGADADRDGVLTNLELRDFVIETVRTIAESRQHPQMLPPRSETKALVSLPSSKQSVAEAPAPSALDPLSLATIGGSVPNWVRELKGVTSVPSDKSADLTIDLRTRDVLSPHGDVVARLDRLDAAVAQQVVDRWRLLRAVNRLGEGRARGLALELQPNDGVHRSGALIRFVLRGHRHPHVTLINLSPDGALQLIFPTDPTGTLPPLLPMAIPATVSGPYGAEHLLALATAAPPETLRRALGSGLAAEEFHGLLAAAIDQDAQLVSRGLYTAPNQ